MSDDISSEVVEMRTVWAVYSFPILAEESGFGPHSEFVRDMLGRGEPEIIYMLDGRATIGGECAVCARLAFRGTCPGIEAHAFTQWVIECTRNVWYPVELGEFSIPDDFDRPAQIAEIRRLIMQHEHEAMRVTPVED